MEEDEGFKVDMHVHSEGSFDGKEPVELILEQASDIGLDAIVVTDHDEIDESLEAAEKASEYGLIGIPGVEVSTMHGHLLAIGVEERPEEGMPYEDTIEKIRELGGAAVVPHPFQRSRHGVRKKNVGEPDAIEVYNSWLLTGYRNRRTKKFARRRDIPGVAASDAHSLATIGRAYTDIKIEGADSVEDVSADDVVEKLRESDHDIHGRRVPMYKSIGHFVKAGVRKTKYSVKRILRR